jgi:hypothetical protein
MKPRLECIPPAISATHIDDTWATIRKQLRFSVWDDNEVFKIMVISGDCPD